MAGGNIILFAVIGWLTMRYAKLFGNTIATLEETKQRLEAIIQTSPLAICTHDMNNTVVTWNPAAERMFGWTEAGAIGYPMLTMSPEKSKGAENPNTMVRNGDSIDQVELVSQRRDGSFINISLSVAPLKDAAEKQYGYLSIMADITERKAAKKQIEFLAYHDSLTGLPNRRSLYEDELKIQIEGSQSHSALLFLDLDNFKYINDTMGHEFGDEFICEVSKRLSKIMRENCNIYRLGGDEFVILMFQVKDVSEVDDFAACVLEDMKGEFVVLGSSLKIGASIGVALYPEHGHTVEELIKSADIAMYKAKEGGKNKSVTYQNVMNKDFEERMTLEKHLNFAIENKEFEVFYQPQISVQTEKVTGLEALLRWNNKELGKVPPLRFIEIAEITRLIIPIGDWVLHQACIFVKKLQETKHTDITISVNISVIQILQTDFTEKVLDTLKEYDLDTSCLELEITETVMAESMDAILGKLQYLSDRGIRIALDDFGKGYSSLNYLMQLPIKTLKIDKSFIDNISTDKDYEGIVSHIINMGKSLGMTIVAEGVELEEQLRYLSKYNCDTIQGYYFSKPLSMEDALIYLNTH
jgi:diguanylate cyclase (GGDEF)-like protein/PAS domain S-box-containing protein